MALFGSSMRDLFGRKPWQTPGIGDGHNRDQFDPMGTQTPDWDMDRTRSQPQEKPRGFWQGGEKLGVKDGLAGILAAVGDAFSQQAGGQGGAVGMLAGGRMDAMAMAQESERTLAKLIAAGVDPAKARLVAGGVAKYGDVTDKPATPYRWESNNGSLMELGADGNPSVRYKDPTPRMNFIPDGMGGGRWVPLPGQETAPPAPVGRLTPLQGGPASPPGGFPRRRY